MRKCFDAIARLGFGRKLLLPGGGEGVLDESKPIPDGAKIIMTTDITAMISPEGESIPLPKVSNIYFVFL